MTRKFAEDTSVPVEKSKAEIESLVAKYGADQFMSGWDSKSAMISFRCDGRFVRLMLPIPDRDKFKYKKRAVNQYKSEPVEQSEAAMNKAWEQSQRRSFRALALVVKAKLEAVASGISTFDQEFMAHLIMPDGRTIAEHLLPQIDEAYKTGQMPKMLLGLPAPDSLEVK